MKRVPPNYKLNEFLLDQISMILICFFVLFASQMAVSVYNNIFHLNRPAALFRPSFIQKPNLFKSTSPPPVGRLWH